ncbi:unnamed protein product, partial [Amoebophrya sp. A25]
DWLSDGYTRFAGIVSSFSAAFMLYYIWGDGGFAWFAQIPASLSTLAKLRGALMTFVDNIVIYIYNY